MLDMEGRFNLLGYLLSDQNVLPMQIIEFRGKDKGFIYKKLDYGGQCLIGSFVQVLDAVNEYMCTDTDDDGNNVALFDFSAFQEAWINACVHNAWWNMIPPAVFIFDDRIEVSSFGNIPYALALENFYTGDSFPVNQSLFEVFTVLHLIGEGENHGVPLIVESCGREAFHFTGSNVIVTIPFRFKPSFVEYREARDQMRNNMDQLRQSILNYLERHPTCKLSEVSEAAGISLSSVKKIVTQLKEDGLLENKGTNRNSIWSIH
jgi:predicted HTH transcriptional regulator